VNGITFDIADRQAAADAVAVARREWDAIGEPSRRAECCWLDACRALTDSDFAGCVQAARTGLEVGGPSTYHAPLLQAWLAWALRLQDHFEAAEAAAASAIELAGDDPYRGTIALGAMAAIAEDRGDWPEVERYFQGQQEIMVRNRVPDIVGRGGVVEHNAVICAILGRTDEALALARAANEIFSTRDNRGLRQIFPLMHRGDPRPGDIEKSLQRHHQRLRLPPLEGAADTLSERLVEFAGRLERLGRRDKAEDCRRALAAVRAATGARDGAQGG
ncbi:MAG: hypothetical protein JXR83_13125, partial [Deltaproteobacteria bacterium]|nr:hypothetical protein [Deltaproteobacteria bacterium]